MHYMVYVICNPARTIFFLGVTGGFTDGIFDTSIITPPGISLWQNCTCLSITKSSVSWMARRITWNNCNRGFIGGGFRKLNTGIRDGETCRISGSTRRSYFPSRSSAIRFIAASIDPTHLG